MNDYTNYDRGRRARNNGFPNRQGYAQPSARNVHAGGHGDEVPDLDNIVANNPFLIALLSFFLLACFVGSAVVVYEFLGAAFAVTMTGLVAVGHFIAAIYFYVVFAAVVSASTMGIFLLMKKHKKRLPLSLFRVMETIDPTHACPSSYVPPPETVLDPLLRAKYLSNGARCVRVGAVCQSVEILLKQEIEAANQKYEKLNAKYWALKDEFATAKVFVQEAEEERQDALREARFTRSDLRTAKHDLSRELKKYEEKLKAMNASHSRELCEVNEQLASVRASRAKLEGAHEALSDSVQKCEKAEKERDDWFHEAIRRDAFNDWMHGENGKLQEQLETEGARNTALLAQNTCLKNRTKGLTTAKADLEARTSDLASAKADLEARTADLQAENADLALAVAARTPLPPTARELRERGALNASPSPSPAAAASSGLPRALIRTTASTSPPVNTSPPAPAAGLPPALGGLKIVRPSPLSAVSTAAPAAPKAALPRALGGPATATAPVRPSPLAAVSTAAAPAPALKAQMVKTQSHHPSRGRPDPPKAVADRDLSPDRKEALYGSDSDRSRRDRS